MAIGIITQNYNLPLNSSQAAVGDCSNSFSWYLTGFGNMIVHNGELINGTQTRTTAVDFAKHGVKENLTENENEDDVFFIMEINLLTNYVSYIIPSMSDSDNMGFSIENIEKPFQIGACFDSRVSNSIGLGIVKLYTKIHHIKANVKVQRKNETKNQSSRYCA